MALLFNIETHRSDIVVLGAGGAGLMAGLQALEKGFSVVCLSKVPPLQSHTIAAKGGINAAFGFIQPDDWRWHMYDTIAGSDYLADHDAVEYMCRHAKETILGLERYGVPFSRHESGRIDQRIYGGQSGHFGTKPPPPRACYVADRTGHAILHTLYQQALAKGLQCFEPYLAISLIIEEGKAQGVMAWDIAEGKLIAFLAPHVIIATGGYTYVYQTSTASSVCTGDGAALAARAGLALQDMEFVQFHPTALYGTGVLISEAARAEGGVLHNGSGEAFMAKYAPKYKDLAARDVVVRAIASELQAGRGAGKKKDHILLDVSHINSESLHQNMPELIESTKHFMGLSAEKDPIPVRPAAHFAMGGIATDADSKVENIKGEKVEGLYAIGEAACTSVHGANRLGCNGLLELFTFAKKVIEFIAGQKLNNVAQPSSAAIEKHCQDLTTLFHADGEHHMANIQQDMQHIMDRYGGVSREKAMLETGLDKLEKAKSSYQKIQIADKSRFWNHSVIDAYTLGNMLTVSHHILHAALARKESRGAHMRSDFQQRDDKNYLKHTVTSEENGVLSVSYKAIRKELEEPFPVPLEVKERRY